VDGLILEATTAMIRDVGVRATTIEAVAAEAGVSVGTVYRRWPNKSALIAAAYRDVLGPVEPPDTGSLRGDLTALAEETFRFFTGEHGKLLAALFSESGGEPEMLHAVHRTASSRRAGLQAIIERAIARREVRADTDVELAIDLFVGPLWTRLLVTGRRITRALVLRIADLTAAALLA
jgi:AcrR family transcriptional regulator